MDRIQDWSKGIRQTVKDAAVGVVSLQNEDGSTASGITWRKGYVVTADEAVGDRVKIVAAGGAVITAELAGRDPSTDIALFKADVAHHPFEASAETYPGDFAIAVGRGTTSELVAAGFIAETGGEWQSLSGGKIDRKIRLGFKLDRRAHGGAVVDAAGRLIGLAAFGPRRRAIVIPVQTVEWITARLEKSGTISRGYIGVQLHPLRDGQRRTGAIIVHLDKEGPGATAGLILGDCIVSWNGEDVTGSRQIFRNLGPDTVGTTVALGILRGGQQSTIDIVVGKRPALIDKMEDEDETEAAHDILASGTLDSISVGLALSDRTLRLRVISMISRMPAVELENVDDADVILTDTAPVQPGTHLVWETL